MDTRSHMEHVITTPMNKATEKYIIQSFYRYN